MNARTRLHSSALVAQRVGRVLAPTGLALSLLTRESTLTVVAWAAGSFFFWVASLETTP